MWLIDRKEFKGNQPGQSERLLRLEGGLAPLVDYQPLALMALPTLSAERCRLPRNANVLWSLCFRSRRSLSL